MNRIFSFSDTLREPPSRTVEDAPLAMRQQLLVAFYEGSEPDPHGHYGQLSVDDDLYLIISGVLGVAAAGNPQPNRRQRMMRDLNHCHDWRLVYDVVVALWPQYHCRNRHDLYRTAVNRVLAMHGMR